jgi:aryl-alcohol dehydrogenase-like predicted oxidoreductase
VKTRALGAGGPTVGAIGLGTMGLSFAYGDVRDVDAEPVLRRALELGCDLIDTADAYGPETSERMVGEALASSREEIVLATKCGLVAHRDAAGMLRMERDGSPAHLGAAIDASLERLRTDAVDLIYLHRIDPGVPLEESVGALAEAVAAGKAKAIGLCEVSLEELRRALSVAPIAAVQSELSLWSRDALAEVLPFCAENGIAFVAYSPLGRGFLTGRLPDLAAAPADDVRRQFPRFQPEAMRANAAIVEALHQVAARHDTTVGQVALAWVLHQGEGIVPIPGTKRIAYLQENAAAAEIELSARDLADLTAAPAAVGARYGATDRPEED